MGFPETIASHTHLFPYILTVSHVVRDVPFVFCLQMVEHRWTCELTKLKETQRLEYKDWLMKLHGQFQQSDGKASQYRYIVQVLNTGILFKFSLCPCDSSQLHVTMCTQK
jgi:hypothetical protein